jgi:hypothetical protein
MEDINNNAIKDVNELNEEGLIPIDNSHLSPEVIEAGRRADEMLAAEESAMEAAIAEIEQERDGEVSTEIIRESQAGLDHQANSEALESQDTQSPLLSHDVQPIEDTVPIPGVSLAPDTLPEPEVDTTQSGRIATTELGYSRMIETGVESPERTIYNDIIQPELESEGSHNPEMLG